MLTTFTQVLILGELQISLDNKDMIIDSWLNTAVSRILLMEHKFCFCYFFVFILILG